MKVPLRKRDIGKIMWLKFWDHFEHTTRIEAVQAVGILMDYDRLQVHIRSWGDPKEKWDKDNHTDSAIIRNTILEWKLFAI